MPTNTDRAKSAAAVSDLHADEQAAQKYAQGRAQQQQGNHQQAQALYNAVLELQPAHAEALHGLGVIAAQEGDPQRALELIDRALAIDPEFALAYCNRGNALRELGQLDAAIASYDRAIAIRPGYAMARNCRRLLLAQKTKSAANGIPAPASEKPGQSAQTYLDRGLRLHNKGQPDEAVTSFDRALALDPDYAEAYCGRALAFRALKEHDAAITDFKRAIALKPDFVQAYYNYGLLLDQLNRPDEAIAAFDRAIEDRQDYARAYIGRGSTLFHLGKYDAAVASFERAIAIDPDNAEAYSHRGAALQASKKLDAAIASYDRAIAIAPDVAGYQWNRSLALLLSGNLRQGWAAYEWRWKNEHLRLTAPQLGPQRPRWSGQEPLTGKTLLLQAEQGLGDTIQFCRYAKLLRERGARVVLRVQTPLRNLLSGLDGVADVVTAKTPSAVDYQCPLLSLPLAFGTELDTIPSPGRYIHGDRQKTSEWRQKLGKKRRLRVGLVWRGSPKHRHDHLRSLGLADIVAALPAGVEYFSLQKDLRKADQIVLGHHTQIRHFGDDLQDFTDTAALCDLMDLVISVDTSVAHLAGAMAKPVWILLPFVPDWRWLLDRDDTPWYPSARLYRQREPGNWRDVLACVAADLSTQVAGKNTGSG